MKKSDVNIKKAMLAYIAFDGIKAKFGEEAENIIREIKISLMTHSTLGKKSFANEDIGSGWLTKKRDGQLIFHHKKFISKGA